MIGNTLQALRLGGYNPRRMLDIGAHIGSFTREFLTVFPDCTPTLLEPNPYCLEDLGKLGFEQHGVAASSEAGATEMFLSREWLQSTGASIYRENTAHFRDEVILKQRVEKVRLDDLFRGRQFDFVKIDTQGSELDIIMGGTALLRQADYILVEISLVEYNIGGATAEALFGKLAELGFHCTEVTEFHRLAGVHDGNLLQIDVLFERRDRLGSSAGADRALGDLRGLARTLCGDGRWNEALLLLDRLEILQPGHLETVKQRVEVLSFSGQTLEALKALAVMKTRTTDVDYLLAEIGAQMPAALELFNANLAAGKVESAEEYVAALAALLPGNAAIINAALACNLSLGRQDQAQKYQAILRALDPDHSFAPPAVAA